MLSSDCYEATPAVLALPLFENLKCVAIYVWLRGCLHEAYMKGWPYYAGSRVVRVLFEILIKKMFTFACEKSASPHRRDLAIAYPISRLIGLEISQPRTQGRGGIKTLAYEAALLLGLVRKFSNNNKQAIKCCPGAKYFNQKNLQKAEFDADTTAFCRLYSKRAGFSYVNKRALLVGLALYVGRM